jgi:hypothetical protein
MSDEKPPRRYIEGDAIRARRGFAARDTGRLDIPEHDPREDETPVENLSPRIILAKLEVHTTQQREALEKLHEKQRLNESAHAMTASRLESLEGWRKITMAIVSAVAVAALGSLWTAYTAAHDSGARDGHVDTRIDQLEHVVDKLGTQIESLWRVRVRSITGDPP